MPPAVFRKLAALVLAVTAALLLSAAAIAGSGGTKPSTGTSPNADRAVDIYYFIAVFTAIIFLLVTVPLLLFIVRYRSRGRPREIEGPQVRGNTRLELAWTVVPVLILTATAAFVFYKLPGITDLEAAAGGRGALEVRVEGRQFYWQYEYPNGVIAIDQLRAPVDRVVRLAITAPRKDVQHSYWVPPLGGKFDAIPGRTSETEFRARKAGVYKGVCGEFCGIQHAAMVMSVRVMPRAEFDRWLAEQDRAQDAGESALGRATYEGACGKCHGLAGQGDIGPRLAGNPITGQADALAQVARQGQGRMPGIAEGWEQRQMEALTSYMKRRFAPRPGGGGAGS